MFITIYVPTSSLGMFLKLRISLVIRALLIKIPMSEKKDDDQNYEFPIEEVRLTVPPTDDPSLPVFTFRACVLGLSTCCMFSAMGAFFGFRQQMVYISTACVDIILLAAGKFMASALPNKSVRVPGTKWTFSLNPGPFNIKEHVLISVFVNSGSNSPLAVEIIALSKVFFHRNIRPLPGLLLVLSSQLLGYGFAGIFMKFLVHSPYMWWPSVLVSVSFYRALHEPEKRLKGGLTRFQFFIMVMVSSFAYFIVPGYLFPSITALSFICWIWKDSITAHQIGSGLHGLGLGSFAIDWTSISAFMGNPMATPTTAIINTMVGFIVYTYVLTAISYWTNAHSARRFPIVSSDMFDSDGQTYNVSRIMNKKFEFDVDAYHNYSKLYLSTLLQYNYGFSFACLTSSISHVALFYGRSIWNQFRRANTAEGEDIHTKLMKKNYEPVPQWWFYSIMLSTTGLAIFTCEAFKEQLQLSYWGVLLAVALLFILILPNGILGATVSSDIPTSMFLEIIIAYIDPGKPIGNLTFKYYGYMSMLAVMGFTADFKLGHYLKIPPKTMFLAQVIGTTFGSIINLSVSWWLLDSIEGMCHPELLPKGSPWTCPAERLTYNSAITLNVVGPQRMFYPDGMYSGMFLFFIIGLAAPVLVWILARAYPERKWIRLINFPVIFAAGYGMPPATAVNYWSWFVVGMVFNFVVFKKCKGWWARYNYLLSAGLEAGSAFMAVLMTLALNLKGIYGVSWWGLDMNDHCPLATCPTSPGIVVKGCPSIY